MTSRPVVLLFDGECRLCRLVTGAVLAWDRRARLAAVALQRPESATLLADLTVEQRMASWHLVMPDESRHSGPAAFPVLFELLPGGRLPAALARRFQRLTARGYELVSGHRPALASLVPGPLVNWADRRIRDREVAVAAFDEGRRGG